MTNPRESKKFPFKPGSLNQQKNPSSTKDSSNPTDQSNRSINTANTERHGEKKDRIDAKDFAKLGSSANVTPLPDDIILRDGQFRVGPYVVSHELARGGMGAVYMAEDPILERKVALKIMAASLLADEEAIRRFQREARATAKIDHPNIARIYMVGQTDNSSPFIAMEFVAGGTLEGFIRRKEELPNSIVADFIIQSAEGLSAALKQSIIHRDLKPANIMLTENNQIKVVDFGLAKLYNEETFRTMAGMVMGTPRYMSPEQAQGREVDLRSDIYSLGATFYHLLSGVSPFDGDNATQIMMKQVTAPLVPLRNHKQTIPLEFDELIRKCMAKDPMMRYQRYEDLISDAAKIKLQWRAREKGNAYELKVSNSTSDSLHAQDDLESTSIVPALQSDLLAAQEEEPTPMWRWYLIAAVGLFAIFGILYLIINLTTGEKLTATAQNTPNKQTGLQYLLNAIIQAQESSEQLESMPPINPDYVAWRATESILKNLSRGVYDFEVNRGEYPAKLRDVVRAEIIFQNFDVDSDDTPLDGWSVPFDYLPNSQTVISAGVDNRHGTEDDLKITLEEVIFTQNQELYDRLQEDENNRINPPAK